MSGGGSAASRDTRREPRAGHAGIWPGLVFVAGLALCGVDAAVAGERYVLVVSGVSGSPALAEEHARLREAFAGALTGAMQLQADRLYVLREAPPGSPDAATGANVRAVVDTLRRRLRRDDVLHVVLFGHGTYDGVDAKFNLVGPDLEAAEWRTLLAGLPSFVVIVNTTGASFPFLQRLAAPRRVVITATDSPAQRYDTVFPRFFVDAFTDPESDLDKDGRLSVGEAFTYASTRTRRWYEQHGQLATERALLDDNGDGVGVEAGVAGSDGALASRLFFDPGPDETWSADPALSQLIARRDALEAAIDELKRKRSFMPAGDYERELERLLIDLARLSRLIRSRS
jgi:hypothetical protein